jgi:arginine decarboxylase
LLEQNGCFAEMADPRYVVLVFGIATTLADMQRLQEAIESWGYEERDEKPIVQDKQNLVKAIMLTSSAPVSFRRNMCKNKAIKRVPLALAEEQMAAEMVIPYPPGIAILYPGEKITAEMISYIQYLAKSGARFQGSADAEMSTIAIFEKFDDETERL